MRLSTSIHGASKIAGRIIIIFICCAAIPITILSVLCYRHVTGQLYQQSHRQLRQSTKAIGMAIYERLLFVEADMKSIESLLSEYAKTDFSTVKESILNGQQLKRYQALFIQDNENKKTVIWSRTDKIPRISIPPVKSSQKNKSIVITLQESDSKARIFMIHKFPIDHPLSGFLIFEINPSYLWGIGYMNALPPLVELNVIGTHDNVLISSIPTPDLLMAKLKEATWSLSEGIEWTSEDTTYLVSPWDLFLKSNFVCENWTIILIKSKRNIFAPIVEFQKTFVLVMLLTLLIVVWLSIFYIRKSLIPIEALKEGTLRVANGDFQKMVEVNSGDELEDFAASFNTMAKQLDRHFKMINAAADIDKAILSSLKTKDIIDTIITRMDQIFSCRRAILFLKESKNTTDFAVHTGNGRNNSGSTSDLVQLSLEDIELFTNHPEYLVFYVNDHLPAFLSELIDNETQGFIVLPILLESKLHGLLAAGYSHPDDLNMNELFQHRQLADQVAVALTNAKLVEDLKQLNIGTLTALARTVDAKSPWTAGHSERVTQYALQVGKAMTLSATELEVLQRAALLHDIGKIGVSASILDKNEKLTNKEFSEIKGHSSIGARILEPIGAYSEIIPIVLQHHERYDGKGYPFGLFGETITLSARIISVCDVYDAMASDRPYRKAVNHEDVLKLIRENAGTQFDPNVVKVFLKVIENASA